MLVERFFDQRSQEHANGRKDLHREHPMASACEPFIVGEPGLGHERCFAFAKYGFHRRSAALKQQTLQRQPQTVQAI